VSPPGGLPGYRRVSLGGSRGRRVHSVGGSIANVLRTPKSKDRFGGSAVEGPSPFPFNLSKMASAD
jgi:hypothetical protein